MYISTVKQNNMQAFTNIFGTKIENKPFYQTCIKTWRVARYEDGELDMVYENKQFETYESCLEECKK